MISSEQVSNNVDACCGSSSERDMQNQQLQGGKRQMRKEFQWYALRLVEQGFPGSYCGVNSVEEGARGL